MLALFVRLTDRVSWGGPAELCNGGAVVGKEVCLRVDLRAGTEEGMAFKRVGGVKGRGEGLGDRGG